MVCVYRSIVRLVHMKNRELLRQIGYHYSDMDHWFNKMEMGYPYEECWGVEELKEIRAWLTKNWPD